MKTTVRMTILSTITGLLAVPAQADLDLSPEIRRLLTDVPTFVASRVNLEDYADARPCGDQEPFDDCFKVREWIAGEGGDTPVETITVGYWKDNDIWNGFMFQDSSYTGHFYNGDYYGLTCQEQKRSGWFTCPNGDRLRPTSGYVDMNGELQGEWIYEWASGEYYTGNYKDDKRHGKGAYTYIDGASYEGDYLNDLKHGEGTFRYSDGRVYTGNWRRGLESGQGELTWANGDRYVGSFVDGARTGRGTYTWANQDIYVGDFIDGRRTGQGVYTWADGGRYEGGFVDGALDGIGSYVYPDGSVDRGRWADGEFLGPEAGSPARPGPDDLPPHQRKNKQ